ncbi:ABC transporter substrate-binding protein [Nonlabens marinus]|uniref:Vitamin B12 ABC transporter, B12-binding component BtuF n=1 Tax=Nonlabens marinus S1-08 TaxID=1454201 RepID=W8VRZ5_9FLAO|nr:ABC transporter substrate-binding protein [Nonlabens marinus]BAO56569.1 vitamin B12 ABC transporter, B12-binding component BtuF [Nonlabens marinus S1-08]
MKNIVLGCSLLIIALLVSCKNEHPAESSAAITVIDTLEVKYAKGFDLLEINDGYRIRIFNPWPGSKDTLQLDVNRQATVGDVQIPVQKFIATSTTHIPPLVLLKETDRLIGFPDTDYISSPVMRKRIDAGNVEDLGSNETVNLERTISLVPDLVMGYGIDADNPLYQSMMESGIPVLYNADWTEDHPLGRAEWIKVFGVLFDKEKEAYEIFNRIESDYLAAKARVKDLEKPTVIAGATWKDVWYLPYGNSWQGTLINDAGGDYIYKHTEGSGSLSYNLERVLTDAQQADYWIAPGQYTSYSKMLADNLSYQRFKAFQEQRLYTFALGTGATGGVIYYEEASMRPDLVLKDLITIFHGNATSDALYFFDPLTD